MAAQKVIGDLRDKDRETAITKTFSDAGVTPTAEERNAFKAMDDATFSFASATLVKAATMAKNTALTKATEFSNDNTDADKLTFAEKALNKALGLEVK